MRGGGPHKPSLSVMSCPVIAPMFYMDVYIFQPVRVPFSEDCVVSSFNIRDLRPGEVGLRPMQGHTANSHKGGVQSHASCFSKTMSQCGHCYSCSLKMVLSQTVLSLFPSQASSLSQLWMF